LKVAFSLIGITEQLMNIYKEYLVWGMKEISIDQKLQDEIVKFIKV